MFREVVVWIIWVPVWGLLIRDALGRHSIDATAELRLLFARLRSAGH
jgi:hypothetical protein